VVIGDGGDFVSFAGKYIEPEHPGGWLNPGPFGRFRMFARPR
jgi:acetolactate synthase-1/2/3 large subunit